MFRFKNPNLVNNLSAILAAVGLFSAAATVPTGLVFIFKWFANGSMPSLVWLVPAALVLAILAVDNKMPEVGIVELRVKWPGVSDDMLEDYELAGSRFYNTRTNSRTDAKWLHANYPELMHEHVVFYKMSQEGQLSSMRFHDHVSRLSKFISVQQQNEAKRRIVEIPHEETLLAMHERIGGTE